MSQTDGLGGLLAQLFSERLTWMERAECRNLDPNLFFTERGESQAEAKAVCAECEVRAECAEWGKDEKFGIFGGASERERRRIRAGRPRADIYRPPHKHGTPGGYRRHLRERTLACDACLAANTLQTAEWKKANKAKGEQ